MMYAIAGEGLFGTQLFAGRRFHAVRDPPPQVRLLHTFSPYSPARCVLIKSSLFQWYQHPLPGHGHRNRLENTSTPLSPRERTSSLGPRS